MAGLPRGLHFGAFLFLTEAPLIELERRVLLRHYLEQGLPKAEIARQLGISARSEADGLLTDIEASWP